MKPTNQVVKGRAIPLGQPLSPLSNGVAEDFAKELRRGINDVIYKGREFGHQKSITYEGGFTACGPIKLSAYRTRDGGYKIVVELDDERYHKPWAKDESPTVEMKKAANQFREQRHKVMVRMIERVILKAQNEAPLWEAKHKAWERIDAIKRSYPERAINDLEDEMSASGRTLDWDSMEADEVEGWLRWAAEYTGGMKSPWAKSTDLPVGDLGEEKGPRGQKGSAGRFPDMAQLPVREVPILVMGDDEQYHVTPEYYALNPNEGELHKVEASPTDQAQIADKIKDEVIQLLDGYDYASEGPVVAGACTVNQKVFPLIKQGAIYDWVHIRRMAKASLMVHLGHIRKEKGLDSLLPPEFAGYYNLAEMVVVFFTLAQNNQFDRDDDREPQFPAVHIGNPDGNLCKEAGPYIGLDQYADCGPTTFSTMCEECLVLLEPQVTGRGEVVSLVCKRCSRPMSPKSFGEKWCGECTAETGPASDDRWAQKGSNSTDWTGDPNASPTDDYLAAFGRPKLSDDEQRAALLNTPKVSRVAVIGWFNNRWQVDDSELRAEPFQEFRVHFSKAHYALGLQKFEEYHDGTSRMCKIRYILLGPDGTLEKPDIVFEGTVDVPGYFSRIVGSEVAQMALIATLRPGNWKSNERKRAFWAAEASHIQGWLMDLRESGNKESVEDTENDPSAH